MQKIVINGCHGGFGLSKQAIDKYFGGGIDYHDISRDDPRLIQAVEELGEKSWGEYAELRIVEVPDDVEWGIEEYDGLEWVAEKHRTWS